MSSPGPRSGSPTIFERLTRVAPLGVRFFDPVGGRYVSDLVISARPDQRAGGRPLPLHANPSAVFVLQGGVPGVRDFEITRATLGSDEDFWDGWPAPARYTLAVSDPLGRYLPFTLPVDVPTRGLYRWDCGPGSRVEAIAGQPEGDVPLFSAPQRPAPEAMAVARAGLYDPVAEGPAAGAIVEVRYSGRLLGRGMADSRGQVVVFLPYPPPLDSLSWSPPEMTSPPGAGSLWEQEWTVNILVGYVPAPEGLPDLCASLLQLRRAPANVWADAARTRVLSEAPLKFGQELILRTTAMSPPETGRSALARLLVTPADSPP